MARYQIIFAYDGSGYSGSQRQASGFRTVQGDLESALRRIGWQGSSILIAGRTDSGVHASGQVAAFDIEWNHDPEQLLRALNSNLPDEIAVKTVQIAQDDFHPRFDAKARRYRYRLYCQPVRDPLRDRYAWRNWPALNVVDMQAAAGFLPGKHDFSAFGTAPRPGSSTVRSVSSARWFQAYGQKQDCDDLVFGADEWFFEIRADAFLYHMVRRLVYVQVAVGQGKFPPEVVLEMLEGKPTALPAGLAPPNGLTLVEVAYTD